MNASSGDTLLRTQAHTVPDTSRDTDALFSLPMIYTTLEASVAVGAFIGNLLVVIVFVQDKRLRKVTNFYIISLAVADLFVGLVGVPSAILTRIGIPHGAINTCLTMLSLLVVLCTISIFNLVAVSLDRYWAILHPLDYHRRISGKKAMFMIIACWIVGALVGFLPLFGWNNDPHPDAKCLFIPVIGYNFLTFLYFSTIVLPALIMAFVYTRIYLVVIKQASPDVFLRQISTFDNRMPGNHYDSQSESSLRRWTKTRKKQGRCRNSNSLDTIHYFPPLSNCSSRGNSNQESPDIEFSKSRSLMALKSLKTASLMVKPIKISFSRREVKKAQSLFIIVVFFMLCWIPLYTLNAVYAVCESCRPPNELLLDFFIILSHLNSVGSPFLYAFHMKDFREALKRLLCKCVLRQQGLRDIRRQELLSISGMTRRVGRVNVSHSCHITPQISPNLSIDGLNF